MDSKHAHELAVNLVGTGRTGTWSVETAAIWLQSGCKGVYCDRDMLENRGIAYYFFSHDHLPPKAKYRELESELSNQVLCCRWRNGLKREWDPNVDG
jgi:hypothetical protein